MAANEARLVFQFEDKGGAGPASAPGATSGGSGAPGTHAPVGGGSPAQHHAASRAEAQAAGGAPAALASGTANKKVTTNPSASKPVSQSAAPPAISGAAHVPPPHSLAQPKPPADSQPHQPADNKTTTKPTSKPVGHRVPPVAPAPQPAPRQPANKTITPNPSASKPAGQSTAGLTTPMAGSTAGHVPPAPQQPQPASNQTRQRWRGGPPQASGTANKGPTAPRTPKQTISPLAAANQGLRSGMAAGGQIAGGVLRGNPLQIGAGLEGLLNVGRGFGEKAASAAEQAKALADHAQQAQDFATRAASRANRLRGALDHMRGLQSVTKPQMALARGRMIKAGKAAEKAAMDARGAIGKAISAGGVARGASMAAAAGTVGIGVGAPLALAGVAAEGARRYANSVRDQLQPVSSEITDALARAELRQVLQDIKSSQKLGGRLATTTTLQSQLSVELQRSRDVLLAPVIDVLNRLLSVSTRVAGPVADFMEKHEEKIKALLDWYFKHGSAAFEVLTLLDKWLKKMLGNELDDPIFKWFEKQEHLRRDLLPGTPEAGAFDESPFADIRANHIALGMPR